MNDFEGLLSNTDYGFKPQGKSAPMSSSRSASSSSRSNADPIFSSRRTNQSSLDDFGDVFGGPPTTTTSSSSARRDDLGFNFDYVSSDSSAKSSGMPVFDKPLYDDDVGTFDNVFASSLKSDTGGAGGGAGAFDDLLDNLGGAGGGVKKETKSFRKGADDFDDLIPGFGGRSSPPSSSRQTSEVNWSQKSTDTATKTRSSLVENPFVVLESSSPSKVPASGISADPSEELGKFNKLGSTRSDRPSGKGGIFNDLDPLDNLGKSLPKFSSEVNDRNKERSPSRTASGKESTDDFSAKNSGERPRKNMSSSNYQESHESIFDMPSNSNGYQHSVGPASSPPAYEDASPSNDHSSRLREDNFGMSDDIWLTVSEVHLYTQPTTAPPPTRPPPPRPGKVPKSEAGGSYTMRTRKQASEFPSFSNSNQQYQTSKSVPASAKSSTVSPIDELEDFAMGGAKANFDGYADVYSGEDVETPSDAFASAAAMKEAMDKAEAKFRHAKELRERENAKASRSREGLHPEREDKSSQDSQDRLRREKEEKLESEQHHREWEEEEREQRRLQQERERAREIEREIEEREQRRLEKERERAREIEREREKARQAVGRATREARERAAAEARLKAERAAVEKVNAQARERAERAAVQRAQAEARERAAAEAKERAEKAAAEAREKAQESRLRAERAAAEAREKAQESRLRAERAAAEAREKAQESRLRAERAAAEARDKAQESRLRAERAAAEAREKAQESRLRAERAATERATAEARERAAAQARERAAAEAREKAAATAAAASAKATQRKNEDDLESFFGMGSRPSSAPRTRTSSSDPFDSQFHTKQTSDAARWTSAGTSSSMKKASSATNIVDDLSSIFGAAPSSFGEFQEVEGETEERRRARLERQQRMQERAAKALAEKNQRDLQAQRDQAERHRIAETLDVEIKRWAAGKEGNLRALLSTMQYVMWPECGWQPVSLTDLITAAAVKKVYRKATLCIHPDKVQQKGANLQQKYIAEKVFDLLKEAWNKFNSEELF